MDELQRRLETLSPEKRALLEKMRNQTQVRSTQRGLPELDAAPMRSPSSIQKRLLTDKQLHPQSAAYNIFGRVSITGPLDIAQLRVALYRTMQRHEICHSTPSFQDAKLQLRVLPEFKLPFSMIDLSHLSAEQQAETRTQLNIREARTLAPLDSLPIRVRLIRNAPHQHQLTLTADHAFLDQVSLNLFLEEVLQRLQRQAPEQPAPAYAAFAEWQGKRLNQLLSARQYWLETLADLSDLNQVAHDRPTPSERHHYTQRLHFQVKQATLGELRELAEDMGTNLFTVYLAAWASLLHRYADHEDFAIGVPHAARPLPETQSMLGPFVNMLPIRVKPRASIPFSDFLETCHQQSLAAYRHYELPYDNILANLAQQRQQHVMQLFQTAVLPQPAMPKLQLDQLQIELEHPNHSASNFDMALYLFDQDQGYGCLDFDQEAFEKVTAQRIQTAYLELLDAIAADPDLQIGQYQLSRHRPVPRKLAQVQQQSLHGAVFARAEAHPEHTAIVDGPVIWRYADLLQHASTVSQCLQSLPREACVGIALPRSAHAIACALGILNAGGTFVFLDTNLPPGRLAEMARISQLHSIFTQATLTFEVPQTTRILKAEIWQKPTLQLAPLRQPASPQALAYLIFTSGSSGEPKAVAGTHLGMLNRISWFQKAFPYRDKDIQAQRTPLNFVDAIHEIFVPLASGVPLHIIDEDTATDATRLLDTLHASQISVLVAVPALLAEIDRQLREHNRIPPRLRLMISSGEPLPPSLARSLRARLPRTRLLNIYGASEVSADVTAFEVNAPPRRNVPIGQPIANVDYLILDNCHSASAPGFPGELCFSGHALARGYLGRPDLTAERFLPHPFASQPGMRIYRSGDLATLDAHNQLRYLGRADRQLKLRGVRLEPGEIESRLERHEAIAAAAITLDAPESGDPQIVAYVEAEAGQRVPDDRSLRQYLGQTLPSSMLPTWIVRLDHLPRTPHGKLNRKALPPLTWTSILKDTSHPQQFSDIEDVIADIWRDVLGKRPPTPQTSFFQIGGHSLAAIRIAARLEERFGMRLRARELFVHDTPSSLAALFEHKPLQIQDPIVIPKNNPSASYRLAPAQMRLWIDASLYGSTSYHIHWALRWHGPLQIEHLRNCLAALVRRHEALRTRIVNPQDKEDEPQALVADSVPLQIEEVDARSGNTTSPLNQLITQHSSKPFTMDQAPLWRVLICHESDERCVISMTLHHQIADGWSISILQEEWLALYIQTLNKSDRALPKIEARYADFAAWQRQDVNTARRERDRQWWKATLAGAPPLLDLPLCKTRQSLQKAIQAAHHCHLTEDLSDDVRRVARAYRTTPFTILLAAYKLLLFHHSRQDDLVIGTATANRPNQAFERVIGFFADLLPLRTDLSDNPTFSLLLARIQENFHAVENHGSLTFDGLVAALNPPRSAICHPIFQVLFLYEGVHFMETPDGTRVEPFDLQMPRTPYDLTLVVTDYGGAMRLRWQYRQDWLDEAVAERLFSHYHGMLRAALDQPENLISDLLPADRISQSWHRRSFTWSRQADQPHVLARFEMMARSQPDAPALIDAAGATAHYSGEWMHTWHYGELDSLANRFAYGLQQQGVTIGDIVAICLPRSAETVASMLATLKCGAAYMPIDPVWPPQRQRDLINHSQTRLVIGSESQKEHLQALPAKFVSLHELGHHQPQAWQTPAMPGSLASHILYTSGSTGTPKGVVLTQDNLKTFFAWSARGMPAGSRTCVLAGTSFCFDLSIYEIFATLDQGGTLLLVDSTLDLPMLPPNLRTRVSLINTVPSVMRELLRTLPELPELRAINLAGEPLRLDLARSLRQRFSRVRISNLYGPSETSVYASSCPLYGEPTQDPAIGKSLPHSRVTIVGPQLTPMPRAIPGQIAIAGYGLARGYLNRPDLTAASFRPNPSGPNGARLYLTGDLGVWDTAGNIHFLGRIDSQIKHRGFRIEPGEIEAALRRHGSVRDAAVILRGFGENAKLCAYLIGQPKAKPDINHLREHLKHLLPMYMMPQHFIVVDHFPLTSNGKLDWRALPDPNKQIETKALTSPGTPTQIRLAELFAKLLERAPIDEDSNFFNEGGHSLLAVQLLARVNREFRTNLSLRDLFEAPTPRTLGERVAKQWANPDEVPPPVLPANQKLADYPLSFAQEHLWFLAQLDPESTAYLLNFAVELKGPLHVASVEQALRAVVERHDVMRTSFVTRNSQPAMVIADQLPVTLNLQQVADSQALWQQLHELSSKPFNLAQAPLFRFTLFEQAAHHHVLLLNIHHIIADAWSASILWRELVTQYEALRGHHRLAFNDLPIQYQDYARWQRDWLEAATLERRLNYWQRALSDMPMRTELPFDQLSKPSTHEPAERVPIHIEAKLTDKLKLLGQRNGSTLFLTLLSAFAILLYRYTGQRDLAIGVPMAGRLMAEVENLIGYFINLVVMRVKVQQDSTFAEIHRQLQNWMMDIHRFRDLPFEKVVETVAPERHLDTDPLIQVVFSHRNMPLEAPKSQQIQINPLEVPNQHAKFNLLIDLEERPDGLHGYLEYRSSRFNRASMQSWVHHFHALLGAIVDDDQQTIAALPILTQSELRQLRGQFDAQRTDYIAAGGLFGAFAAQAARSADKLAIVDAQVEGQPGKHQFTYRQALDASGKLALAIQACEIKLEEMIGLAIPRSALTVLAKLGILQAGAAYLPLDLDLPSERIDSILQRAKVRVVVCNRDTAERFADYRCVIIEDAMLAPMAISTQHYLDPDQLAYAMFTSGSTGQPKAVGISHRGVMRLILGGELFQAKADRTFLHHSPPAFDASTFEVWGALLTGACLVVAPPQQLTAQQYALLIEANKVDVMWLTAALFSMIAESHPQAFQPLKLLFAGGDVLAPQHCRTAFANMSQGTLVNGYGPTENTTFSCCYPIFDLPADDQAIPIGRPIGNATAYVLDTQMYPLPKGAWGTLYVGGEGLARGYLSDPARTAAAFLPHPFASRPGRRLYNTGDRARFDRDGYLMFGGRLDHQVKIRGFRVELGEIESVLRNAPLVADVVCVVSGAAASDKHVVAYLKPEPNQELQEGALRRYAFEHLPNYMIPEKLCQLETFPISTTGKVDRRRLPKPDSVLLNADGPTFIAPQTHTERGLADIWSNLLDLNAPGLQDNFFEVGGNSLLAVQLFSEIEKRFRKRLPIAALLESPTLGSLAKRLAQTAMTHPIGLIVPLRSEGEQTPLFLIHSLGGDVLIYHRLAKHLKPGRPVFGLQLQGLDGQEVAHSHITEIAKSYVDRMRQLQPQGPYALAGFCTGGVIAHEMACQLRKQNQEVAFLGLVESIPFNLLKPFPWWQPLHLFYFVRNLWRWSWHNFKQPPKHVAGSVKGKLRRLKALVRGALGDQVKGNLRIEDLLYEDVSHFPEFRLNLMKIHYQELIQFVPEYYQGQADLFRLRRQPLLSRPSQGLGWEQLVKQFDTYHLDGTHITLLDEPYVEQLAQQMEQAFSKRMPKP